jgi:hypothetical protein
MRCFGCLGEHESLKEGFAQMEKPRWMFCIDGEFEIRRTKLQLSWRTSANDDGPLVDVVDLNCFAGKSSCVGGCLVMW